MSGSMTPTISMKSWMKFMRGIVFCETTGYKNVDELYTASGGHYSGHRLPSCGKSEFIDQLMTNLAENRGGSFQHAF